MEAQGAATGLLPSNEVPQENGKRMKLHGRAFYESIGSPKLVLAPMVEQSEFVCLIIASVLSHFEIMR
jgi:tRNA-dihydrouridine synthase 1